MIKQTLLIFSLLTSILFAEGLSNDEVELYSNSLQFKQNNRLVVASSNVHLHLGDIVIETDRLMMDVDQKIAWGTGNIVIKRGEDEFRSNYFLLNIDQRTVVLKDISLRITPHENKGDLFFRAKSLIDTGDIKYGKGGRVTSCDHPDHPHHFLWAYKFEYIPQKRIILYGGILYNEFNFFPFNYLPPIPLVEVYPLPYYFYELGKRKIVWNFPVLGKKDRLGWGYFMQNSIDYKHANRKDSSLLVDYYEYRGWGFGIRHYYEFKKNDGMVYLYNFDFDELATEQGQLVRTGKKQHNRKVKLENTYHATEFFDITTKFEDEDVDERINSSGKSNKEYKELELDYDKLGDQYKLKTKENININNSTRQFYLTFDRKFNDEKRYGANLSDFYYYSSGRVKSDYKFYYNLYLPENWRVNNDIKFTREDYTNPSDRLAADQLLKTQTTISKQLNPRLKLDINIEQMVDIDENEYRLDSESNRNDFLYKHPEINLNYNNSNFYNTSLRQKVMIARYQEARYDRQTKTRRIYPTNSDMAIEPNVYYYQGNLNKNFTNDKHKINFNIGTGYEQYIFKIPEKNIFEGDAIYGFDFNSSLSKDSFNHIITRTSYSSKYAPIENNSPFYSIGKNVQEQNTISQSIDFYIDSPDKYKWGNKTGYTWIQERYTDYYTNIHIKPNSLFQLDMHTGKNLSPKTDYERENRYHPFQLSTVITPSENISFTYDISIDTTKWIDKNITEVRSSFFKIKTSLGKNKDYQWEIETIYRYKTEADLDKTNIEIDKYEMETINIVKKEHKRSLIVGYNKQLDELQFKYRLDAFPDDALELQKRKDIWKVEGRFNEQAIERL